MKKKKKKVASKITIADFIKAVKKADRDIEINETIGWSRQTKIHKNKKAYDRKRSKGKYSED